MSNFARIIAVFGLAVAAAGCADPPAPKTPAAVAPPVATTAEAPAPVHVKRPVNVSDEIRVACGLPDPKDAPKFDFDNAEITGDDKDVADKLAKCMIDGALKGKDVLLLGRADARGETEYNMALGARRAENLKKLLTARGVAESRLSRTSRGELDAKGGDEEGYRLDRRVDVELKK